MLNLNVVWKSFQMFRNNFTLKAKGLVPMIGTEGVPAMMCSGGVVAFLNWEGSSYKCGDEGAAVFRLLLGDPGKTGVHSKAVVRARSSLFAQIYWKEVWLSDAERNKMVS